MDQKKEDRTTEPKAQTPRARLISDFHQLVKRLAKAQGTKLSGDKNK